MSKKLAVYDDVTRRLEGLDPGQATGIAVPTARVMQTLPAAGSVSGELVYVQATGISYIWEGAQWSPIISDFLHTFATDADVLAAVIPDGHIAISEGTGNFFIKTASGFRQWGVREYATRANMLADAPPDGSIAVAMDDHSFWMRVAGDWNPISTVEFADPAALTAWAAPDGAQAFEATYGTSYFRAYGRWYPRGVWPSVEATILANNDLVEGQIAFATDTGRLWIRTATSWEGSPIRNYATEVALLAATPADGILAWAEDTGLAYMRSGGTWRRVNSPTITAAPAPPTTPSAGDIHFEPAAGVATIYDGAAWRAVGGAPTGTIIQHVSITPPPGYLLCDGSPIPAGAQYNALRAMVGANTPNLSSQFIRAAASQQQIDGFTQHSDTTRRPRNTNFTGTTDTRGRHTHPGTYSSKSSGGGQESITPNDWAHNWQGYVDWIQPDGNHNHNVTINGGGDAETAPRHVYLAMHIKF